ncbi:hypothetical protein EsH8_II_001310 [Colletotrichum jinshuiense]
MTSSRPRADVGGSFASRRGHAPQLSISDPSHHVTETIGTLYGDEEDYSSDQRPLSFLDTPYTDQAQKQADSETSGDDPRRQVTRSATDKTGLAPIQNGPLTLKKSQTLPTRSPSQRSMSFENGPKSPPISLRDVKNESSQFPLGNIENPNDIAQELSNLQALRRMSMDVGNNADPDMLPFSGLSLMAMPPIAPTGDDDENDPSRLLWVPAAVHPELAPTEFKNFLEDRVKTIRRRSGDSSNGGMDRSDSSGGLRRKKSMLSRQIDNSGGRGAEGYVDGAERLGRTSSLRDYSTPELNLNELVKDPSKVVRELSKETQAESGAEDMPILPVAPGMGLRRSTRTTYRKNGSVRSDRLPFSKRVASRHGHTDSSDSADTVPPLPSDVPEVPKVPSHARVQSEPVSENFSRPNRSVRRQHKFSQDMGTAQPGSDGASSEVDEPVSPLSTRPEQQHPARTSSVSADARQTVPSIVESPTTEESVQRQQFPQRSSSQNASQQIPPQSPVEEPSSRSSIRPGSSHSVQSPTTPTAHQQPQQQQAKQQANAPNHAPNDMASYQSSLPASGATRTDTLTFIPTLPAEEKKPEEKRVAGKLRKERDDDAASVSSTKSSGGWSKWLKGGSDDKEKKKKEEEKKKKIFVEKAQDNARLDVLQNSIEGASSKGRESIIVDRDNVDNKLAEERKKESKKSEAKKEKEGGLFSGLFGGGKKKSEKDSGSKKNQHLRVSEEVPYRPLKPDVDYHWTRFPLLEERAIYRMAHIKLANPRRSLMSQVLLSNFMYNYLAIVQAMHPQMQVPQSPQQRRLEEERRRKEQEEQYLAQQQMQQQQDAADQESTGQYNFEYHRGDNQYGDHPHDEVDYVDDAQIYEYDHGSDENGRSNGYNSPDNYDPQPGKQYYHDQYGRDSGDEGRRRDDREDMW